MPRVAEHEIDPQFLERWSRRAMNGEPMSESDLMRLFEAARWAPSNSNNQPWRFLYAGAGTPHFERFLNLLNARSDLGVPDNFEVECMVAVGRRGRVEDLPGQQRAREVS